MHVKISRNLPPPDHHIRPENQANGGIIMAKCPESIATGLDCVMELQHHKLEVFHGRIILKSNL